NSATTSPWHIAMPLGAVHPITEEIRVDSRIVKKEKILSEGDIFICMANGSKNLVGKSAYYYRENSTKTVGSFCSIFRTNKSNSSRFVFSLFEITFYRDKIEIILSGTSINNLKPSDIEGMSWFIPPLPSPPRTKSHRCCPNNSRRRNYGN
ncbi:hypothetical protein, partial [Acetobacter indonesiensis]